MAYQHILSRLLVNLESLGIAVDDEDIAAQLEHGYLREVEHFEDLLVRRPAAHTPEFLAGRDPVAGIQAAAASASGPVEEQGASSYPPLPAPPRGLPDGGGRSYATLSAIAARIATGEVSPVEVVEQSLQAISEFDGELNAFQCVLADAARTAAREAEHAIQEGRYRGPLHGVPVAVKDLFQMQGTPTTAGSSILADWRPAEDATVVEKLKMAGAVIVGKTRLSEYAYSPGSNNVHYGSTRNPWNLDHDTGGSSSGSGAAVAAGMVYAALGSDTGGSIRIPASQCGLVGLKPTYGRTSLFGAVSLAWSLDHAGPLARSVRDVAIVMDAIQGHDPRDARSRAVPGSASLVAALESGQGFRTRIGVPRSIEIGAVHCAPVALEAWKQGLRVLEHHGCDLVEIDLPELDDLRLVNSVILVLEAAAFHHRQLAGRFTDYGTFFRRRVLRAFAYAADAYIQAQQVRAALRTRLDALLEQVDLVSTPTMPGGAPLLGTPAATTFTAPFNLLGWPTVTVPVGQTHEGLPLGLQLAGKPWDDGSVLRTARILEHHGAWFAHG